MLVDRFGFATLVLGAAGIAWLARPQPSKAFEPNMPSSYESAGGEATITDCVGARIPIACSINGGTPEAMQGPFASLGDAVGGELDVKTMVGVAPFQQLTVVRVGDGTPDLTNHDRLVLVVQVGGAWFTRELATLGPFCGGMGNPTWVDAEAGAPRIVDGAVSVRVHETYRQGDSERTSDSLVECRLDP